MNRSLLLLLCLTAVPAAARGQLPADQVFRAGTWILTAELGGAAFTDFKRVQATMTPVAGEVTDFERRVSARTAATFGARVAYWPHNSFGIRGGVSYAPSTFTVANGATAERVLDSAGADASDSYASLGVWMADAVALVRAPRSFGRVLPYGIVGAGAVRYERGHDAAMPPEAAHTFENGHRTRAAAVFGIGAALPLQRSDMLLSFELTNHLSRSPLGDDATTNRFAVRGVDMEIDEESIANSDAPGLTSNLRLVVQFSIPLR